MTTGFQKRRQIIARILPSLQTVEHKILLQKYMIAEVAEGMDLNSYNGPYVERTIAKSGRYQKPVQVTALLRSWSRKLLRLLLLHKNETGCPISMHTDFGTMGSEILDEIEKNWGKSEKAVLCHMQRNPDRYYYSSILDRGATICFDEPNKAAYRPDTEIAENICWLLDRGL